MYPTKDDERGPAPELEQVDPKLFRRLIDRQRGRDEEEAASSGRGRGVLTPMKRRLLPASPKDQIVGKIRESFEDLNSVLGAIDRKIDEHNQTSAKLENSVRNLPELMEGLPAASKAGVTLLEDLRSTLTTQTSLTKDVVQSVEALATRVAQIPDALARFDERLDRQELDQRRAVDALATLQEAVVAMQDESARVQQQTFEQLQVALKADREETRRALDADRAVLTQVVERSNRQMMLVMVLMIVVVGAVAAAILMQGS